MQLQLPEGIPPLPMQVPRKPSRVQRAPTSLPRQAESELNPQVAGFSLRAFLVEPELPPGMLPAQVTVVSSSEALTVTDSPG